MKRLFLYGDVADNFGTTSIPFVEAAGGRAAKIALLLTGGPGWDRYVAVYRDPWMRAGAAEVIPIAPHGDATDLGVEAVSQLRSCSGIFVGGGDMHRYQRIYACPEIRTIICELYESGVPYGGASAGAQICTEACILGGSSVRTSDNEYRILASGHEEPVEGSEQLTMAKGLGLLRDCVVDVHLSETGAFPRLIQGMELAKASHGLGLDEPICLEVRDGCRVKVHGYGRAYLVMRLGILRFELRVLEAGNELEM